MRITGSSGPPLHEALFLPGQELQCLPSRTALRLASTASQLSIQSRRPPLPRAAWLGLFRGSGAAFKHQGLRSKDSRGSAHTVRTGGSQGTELPCMEPQPGPFAGLKQR